NRTPLVLRQDGIGHGNREDLVRPTRRIVPNFTIDNVIKSLLGFTPEPFVERGLRLIGGRSNFRGAFAGFFHPTFQPTYRVVPQPVNLDGFASTWSHAPVTDFCVHPSQLIARRSLLEQSVIRIDADSEPSPSHVVCDNVFQGWQVGGQHTSIAADLHISA